MRRVFLIVCAWIWLNPLPCPARGWRTLENCTLAPNEANDGDSFHVKYKRREYIFRIYFADAPETEDTFPERLGEQAEYWGISSNATLKLGREAAAFTRKFLADGFTVYTKFDDARGRSDKERFFAVVKVGDQDLAEVLVGQGLARVFGQETELPDGKSSTTMWWRLKTAEREAKKQKLGGWSPQQTQPENKKPALPGFVAEMPERDVVLAYTIPVYSLNDPFPQVGILERGAQVRVLKLESPAMVRVRFTTPSGKVYEAQCRRVDLGL